jgi:hypothetical protein
MIRGVLIITPEYPPKVLGQTSLRARELAGRMRDEGLLVSALVHDDVLVGNFIEDSIRVVRISNPIRTYYSVLTVEMFLTTQFIREGKRLIEGEMVDLIVSFEWLTLASACALKMGFGVPLVSIVQSTEPQRSAWRRDPLSITIENFEKSLLAKADLVVPYSTQTMNVLSDYYRVDQRKIASFDLHSEYAIKALLSLVDRGGDEDESPDVDVGISS